MPGPKKPFNPDTWQGQLLDTMEDIRIAIETGSIGPGASSEPDYTWQDGQCSGCVHFQPIGTGTFGWCRRFPPVIESELSDGTQDSTWPQVNDNDSCSEFSPTP